MTVVGKPYIAEKNRPRVAVVCDCGNKGAVLVYSLGGRRGTTSCGCYRDERAAVSNLKHGESTSRLYDIWVGMRNRCNSPNNQEYANYGGRGISYDPSWDDYIAFRDWALANGYQDDLSIDRIDNDDNYGPKNCQWSTRGVQARNTTRNRMLSAFGEEKIMVEWTEDSRCIVGYGTVDSRLRRGWEAERAITTPAETKFRVGR